MIVWNSTTMVGVAKPSTDAFRLLGFENPEKVNLNGYTSRDVLRRECLERREPIPAKYYILRECQYKDVYSLRKAIEDGKVKLKSK